MSDRRVPVNAAALLAGRVTSALATVAIVSLAAHRLDDAQFGLVVSVMAGGFLANTLVTFGTDTVVTRAVAAEREDANRVASASLRLQLGVATGLVVAAVVATTMGADIAILLQALALVPLAVMTVVGAVLRGRQRMDLLLAATVSGAIVSLLVVAVGLARFAAAWVPIAGLGVGASISAGIGWRLARLSDEAPARTQPTRLGAMARETAPFAAMVFLAALGAQAGLLLVEFGSAEATGGYGVAIRLSEAARLIPAAVMGAFFPAMLHGAHRTPQYRQAIRGLLGYAVVATIVLVIVAGFVNRLVFDDQPGGSTLIRILALGLTFTVLRLAWSFELIAAGRERVVLLSALVAAFITLAGGFAAAGPGGAVGVAWVQLAGLVVATAAVGLGRASSQRTSAPAPIGMGKVDRGNR